MQQGSPATEFIDLLSGALKKAVSDGVPLTPGASAMYPESFDGLQAPPAGVLDAFEADPVTSRNPGPQVAHSGFSYFLDGTQEVHEVCRAGTVPVVVATVAAAIAHRRGRRLSRFSLEYTPDMVRAVILPKKGADPVSSALFEAVEEAGIPVAADASDAHPQAPAVLIDSTLYDPEIEAGDYAGLRTRAFGRVRALRESLETELLRAWAASGAREEGWIAVDGQLPLNVGGAAGLIKSSSRPFLRGKENEMLLDLGAGRRTTAFIPPWQVHRRDQGHPEEARASWYVRMWPPQGEATEGLLRVETAADAGWSSEEYDEITHWILAERAPLSAPDPRWRTMIYPIRHVERMIRPQVCDQRRQRTRLARALRELTATGGE